MSEIKEIYDVHRLDDNGNVFTIITGLTDEESMKLVQEMTEKGHKQTYFRRFTGSKGE